MASEATSEHLIRKFFMGELSIPPDPPSMCVLTHAHESFAPPISNVFHLRCTHFYESFSNTMLGLKVVWQKLEIVVGRYSQVSKFPGS